MLTVNLEISSSEKTNLNGTHIFEIEEAQISSIGEIILDSWLGQFPAVPNKMGIFKVKVPIIGPISEDVEYLDYTVYHCVTKDSQRGSASESLRVRNPFFVRKPFRPKLLSATIIETH